MTQLSVGLRCCRSRGLSSRSPSRKTSWSRVEEPARPARFPQWPSRKRPPKGRMGKRSGLQGSVGNPGLSVRRSSHHQFGSADRRPFRRSRICSSRRASGEGCSCMTCTRRTTGRLRSASSRFLYGRSSGKSPCSQGSGVDLSWIQVPAF